MNTVIIESGFNFYPLFTSAACLALGATALSYRSFVVNRAMLGILAVCALSVVAYTSLRLTHLFSDQYLMTPGYESMLADSLASVWQGTALSLVGITAGLSLVAFSKYFASKKKFVAERSY